MRVHHLGVSVLCAGVLSGCAGDGRRPARPADDAPEAVDASLGGDAGSPRDAGPRSDVPPLPGCEGNAYGRYIFLLTADGDLVEFSPETLTERVIGRLSCAFMQEEDEAPVTPYSMSVTRDGRAIVLWENGEHAFVTSIDVDTLACRIEHEIWDAPGGPWIIYSQAFVTLPGLAEQLFIASAAGLSRLDPTTWEQGPVTPFPTAMGNLEISGNAEGHLHGFFASAPGAHPVLAEIDPSTAALVAPVTLDAITVNWAWTFASWGGVFWIFTTSSRTANAVLHRYDPSTGAVDIVRDDLPFAVFGVGVNTCAPDVF